MLDKPEDAWVYSYLQEGESLTYLAGARANADPSVREAADVVTGNNNEGGFANAVERFAL